MPQNTPFVINLLLDRFFELLPFAIPRASVQGELFECLPLLFLSRVSMPPQFDSVTDFHGLAQHSGFQVIWSHNSFGLSSK